MYTMLWKNCNTITCSELGHSSRVYGVNTQTLTLTRLSCGKIGSFKFVQVDGNETKRKDSRKD